MVNPSTHLENDEFGYACYTIVAPAPSELDGPLLDIEKAAGQERAKIPAHVTVKGTFYDIKSLDNLLVATSQLISIQQVWKLANRITA
jgi:hypothetical protein